MSAATSLGDVVLVLSTRAFVNESNDPIVAMPDHAAAIYQYMVIALTILWCTGFFYIVSFMFGCRNAFLNSKPIPNALLAALHGVSDLPVAVRFSKDQGSRWVTVCLFGMTVTALFNLTGVVLFGNVNLEGPKGIFYFYSYFIIYATLGAYFWPIFISHTLVHRSRGRLFGMIYSGLVLCTVFLTSVYNDQSRVYALVLNAPYMICGTLIFGYFAAAFAFYRPPPKSEKAARDRQRPLRLDKYFFEFEKSYVRKLVTPPAKANYLAAWEAKCKKALKHSDDEDTRQEIEEETQTVHKYYGSVRRYLRAGAEWVAEKANMAFERLVFGYEESKCRFSTRLLTGLVMTLMITYEIAIFLDFQSVVLAAPYLGTDMADEIETLIVWTTVFATSLSFLIILFQALLTLRTYRIHMGYLRKGDYSFIPGGGTVAGRKKLRYDLTDTSGFVGFQVGYSFVGFFFIFIIAELLMVLIWAVIYIESVRDSVIQMLITLSLPVLSVTIFIMVQKAAIRWYYLSSKVGDETGGTDGHFYTPHFNSFSHYEYFMTFISTMRGFISYLWSRLLTPLGFLFFFSTRLDRCGVVQGWESMDEGYCSYLGILLADHHYNNPINLIFLLNLSTVIDEKRMLELDLAHGHGKKAPSVNPSNSSGNAVNIIHSGATSIQGDESEKTGLLSDTDDARIPLLQAAESTPFSEAVVAAEPKAVSAVSPGVLTRRRRNLWWLAITLSNNPSLVSLRKHNLLAVVVGNQEAL